jgi:hypothetical protein
MIVQEMVNATLWIALAIMAIQGMIALLFLMDVALVTVHKVKAEEYA